METERVKLLGITAMTLVAIGFLVFATIFSVSKNHVLSDACSKLPTASEIRQCVTGEGK